MKLLVSCIACSVVFGVIGFSMGFKEGWSEANERWFDASAKDPLEMYFENYIKYSDLVDSLESNPDPSAELLNQIEMFTEQMRINAGMLYNVCNSEPDCNFFEDQEHSKHLDKIKDLAITSQSNSQPTAAGTAQSAAPN